MAEPKYKIEVKWDQWDATEKKRKVIPLPVDKVTGIGWNSMVKVLAECGVGIAENIRHHSVGQKSGTRMLNRAELLTLWKSVENYRAKNPPAAP